MDVLARADGSIFVELGIGQCSEFVCPFPGMLYPCLIWDHGAGWTREERLVLAAALVASGCRYAVCAGEQCEAWHDTADLARDQAFEGVESDSAFVMTTWHEGESPDEVAFLLVMGTQFEDHDFRRYLVLHIGTGPRRAEVNAAVKAWAAGLERRAD